MKQLLVLFSLALTSVAGKAIDVELYLNSALTTVYTQDIAATSFNFSSTFSMKNSIVEVDVDDEVLFTIHNTDTVSHTFTIDGMLEMDNTIGPGATEVFALTFTSNGTHRFYSDSAQGKWLGASGSILVGYAENPKFHWNLFDLQTELTHEIHQGLVDEIPSSYQPEMFLINGAFYPETLEDEDTYITGQVGDQIIISIVNSGLMDHILHFHGYHVEILDARILSGRVGWIKDSLPIKKGEAMTVLLSPDKPGEYPVHDHNLIAVTNVGFYPGGMLTYLNIE
ncbi:MAG: plastocyanin [Flavobacteriales bacterium]|jgi:plastocyanin